MARPRKAPRKATGIGGIFLRSTNPKRLARWYRDSLGLAVDGSMAIFEWSSPRGPRKKGATVWSVLPAKDPYWGKTRASAMVNYRVADLGALVTALRRRGASVDGEIQETPFGRFAWVIDPDGNRVELWQPPARYTRSKRSISME